MTQIYYTDILKVHGVNYQCSGPSLAVSGSPISACDTSLMKYFNIKLYLHVISAYVIPSLKIFLQFWVSISSKAI